MIGSCGGRLVEGVRSSLVLFLPHLPPYPVYFASSLPLTIFRLFCGRGGQPCHHSTRSEEDRKRNRAGNAAYTAVGRMAAGTRILGGPRARPAVSCAVAPEDTRTSKAHARYRERGNGSALSFFVCACSSGRGRCVECSPVEQTTKTKKEQEVSDVEGGRLTEVRRKRSKCGAFL